MFIINEKGLALLNLYINKAVAATIGVHYNTIGAIKKERKSCNKQTAYCLTKFLNKDAEIEDYFTREEK